MLTQEQAAEIKVLARRGTAVREIARRAGLSRNTVRRYLRDEQAARYSNATRNNIDVTLTLV